VIHLQGFRGILNSTTNVILSEMENGLSFDESLKKAQALGIAETDATHDIEGWDAAVKTAALITVLMDVPVRLEKMEREGIRGLSGRPCAQQEKKAVLTNWSAAREKRRAESRRAWVLSKSR